MYTLGIDMGGTHTAIGLVQERKILSVTEFPTRTENGVDSYIDELYSHVQSFLQDKNISMEQIQAIGMGVPGNVNQDTGMVEYANNLGFSNVPFQKNLEKRFGVPVRVDNDANLAALGEYLLSGSDVRSFVMVTLGTGIGAGIILDGNIYRGINFAEGELGHMSIAFDGRRCNCGRRGCFEAYASASALMGQIKRQMGRERDSLLWKLTEGNKKNINGKKFFQAVEQKDNVACKILDRYTDYLAEGLINIINILQPEELVIGGGISGAWELFLPQTKEKIAQKVYSRESEKNTEIRAARFGNDAGIIGAAALCENIG